MGFFLQSLDHPCKLFDAVFPCEIDARVAEPYDGVASRADPVI